MLNTPPDLKAEDLVTHSDEGCWENECKATKELLLSPEPPVAVEADREHAVVEVAKLAVSQLKDRKKHQKRLVFLSFF